MVFSFRFWWLCISKHTEGVPMAQLFATGIYTTIWTLPGINPVAQHFKHLEGHHDFVLFHIVADEFQYFLHNHLRGS